MSQRSSVDPQPVAREWDRRAGTTYQPMPRVELLDAYEMNVVAGGCGGVGAGVYESLEVDRSAYPEVLEFGLNVHLPRKFSGMSLLWHPHDAATQQIGPQSFYVKLTALQGHEDRAEVWDQSSKSYDQAPTAN